MKSYTLKRILRVLFIWLISSIAVISSTRLAFASTNVSGRISANTTWTLAGSPYIVVGSVSVYGTPTQTAKLTIEPGVQVKFNGNYIISVGSGTNKGALYAVGTSDNPIIFTSNKPSPARGDWDSIKFYDATDDALTVMTYCTVEYGGSNSTYGNVYIQKSAPTITNCTIRYSKYVGIGCNNASPVITGGTIADNNTKGIYASGQSLITINSTSFSGNGSYAISQGADDELFSTQGITGSAGDRVEIRAGNIIRDQSWRNLGIPYSLSGGIAIYKDATTAAKLTVEPGVQVKFNGNYYIAVGSGTYKGALYAVGTSSNPIVFTSDKPSPARGDWESIRFPDATDDALTVMTYCTVEYGGSNSSYGNVYIQKSAPTITNCTIRYSKYVGIGCSNGSPVITGGTIADNNTKGIYASGQSLITINSTSFSGNGSYAIS